MESLFTPLWNRRVGYSLQANLQISWKSDLRDHRHETHPENAMYCITCPLLRPFSLEENRISGTKLPSVVSSRRTTERRAKFRPVLANRENAFAHEERTLERAIERIVDVRNAATIVAPPSVTRAIRLGAKNKKEKKERSETACDCRKRDERRERQVGREEEGERTPRLGEMRDKMTKREPRDGLEIPGY